MPDFDLSAKTMENLSNAADLASSAGSAAVSAVTNAATNIGNAAKNAFNNAAGLVTDLTESNEKPLSNWNNKGSGTSLSNKAGFVDLFPIGRPCRFNGTVDKYQRFGNYLRAKMSVIDLIPVDYGMNLKRMASLVKGEEVKTEEGSSNSIFDIGYEKNIKLFQDLCWYHGLSGEDCDDKKEYAGIRLFTTDDTTANDTIQVQYKDSSFQGLSDGMSQLGQKYKDMAMSISATGAREFATNASEILRKKSAEITGAAGGGPVLQDLISGLTSVAGDMLISGNKMTFPKIWQSTTYSGHLSVNIRLVSPYGHPAAVKEFILKPISYLILLAAPQTPNGVTYGNNIPVTIKAYGLNYTVLGSIASMTFRRGGSDTSFNLYRQPLTIDVSIEFQTLFDAFAVFNPSLDNDLTMDMDIFKDSMLTSADDLNMYTAENKNHLMTSLGTILASLRPVRIVDTQMDPQVYGSFTPPDRADIPDAPSFTPLTGNLGSTISSAVSSFGNFANMVTNAPSLIQQGISNAVYNTAKGTVNSIATTASSWISKPAAAADAVRNTIMGNLF